MTASGRRQRVPTLTTVQKIQRREKALTVYESEIRNYHTQIAELHDRVAHAERMREETRRELDELKSSES